MSDTTNESRRFRFPAEWMRHEACWLAWPHLEDWGVHLDAAKREVVGLAEAIADVDGATGVRRGEALRVIARHEDVSEVRGHIGHLAVEVVELPFGDIWMRDTLPLFLLDGQRSLGAACFRFNGWGGKYLYDGDDLLAGRVAERVRASVIRGGVVLEGGAVDTDGLGTLLTTRQCLLNANRNSGLSERDLEEVLASVLGTEHVVWIDRGLANDHTDGHVDTIARFVRPGVVVCMSARERDDPNADVYREIVRTLEGSRDARGQKLEIVQLPSPGRVVDDSGQVMPASYVNFFIANTTVVVPTYGGRWDEEAVETLRGLFPDRRVVGAKSRAILTGGGAFHCVTQQQPMRSER